MNGANPKMPEANKCPLCGTPLKNPALGGLCPACLLKEGAAGDTVTGGQRFPFFEPPSATELAAKFPQLEVLELIGKGGMGAVYKARQKELDRVVALKILPPGIGDEAGFAERFAREAKALAKLNHPGIVTIHDFGRTDGLFYFVMEFVDGVNLRQLLQGSRISAHEALAIVPQICDALQFAHDHGIVHRDIKPENILMDRRGRVKMADFGLAKLVGADAPLTLSLSPSDGERVAKPGEGDPIVTDAGKVMGTPNYMAPEQINNPSEVDHRADIYALGVVFYQMLTGELPEKQLQPPSSKVQIDVRLDEIVLRALEKKPELRYQQVSEVKTGVENLSVERGPITQQEVAANIPSSESKTFLASIRIPLVILRDAKPVTNWPIVFLTGALMVFLMAGTMIATAGYSFSDRSVGWVLKYMVLPVALLIPLWLFLEIRTGHRALDKGMQPQPLFAKRKHWLHRAVINLMVALLAVVAIRAVVAPFKAMNDSVSPEIPQGSKVFVFKLARSFDPGDVIVYRNTNQAWMARVFEKGPRNGVVLATRRDQAAPFAIPASDIFGKVIFNTRTAGSNTPRKENAAIKAQALKPIPPEALIAVRDWAAFFKSKTVREMADPDTQADFEKLQKRFASLLSGTIAQPLWDKLEKVSKEARRAYSEGKDEEFRRLHEEQNQLGAQLMSLVETASNRGTDFSSSIFGPVMDRVLPDPDNGAGKGNRETLHLQTGEQLSVLDGAPKEQGGRLRALIASKGDLFAEYDDFVSKSWAFTTAGLKLSDFPTRQWDTATAAEVNEALKVPTAMQRVEHSGATLYLLPDGLLPLTLAFQSRNGERGLLQVTAFNDNPRTVTIRYKRLQNSQGTNIARSNPVYSPPDFKIFFPDDAGGGRKLDALWNSSDKETRSDAEILQTVRNGLRQSQKRSDILRWLGNRYIWNKNPQNSDAIEIMYHAADWRGANADPFGTRHYAVYFGLSVVQPKTPAILRALADLCMVVDDPNDLDRVAWGVKNQQADFLIHLKPHLTAETESVREKARLVEQIIKGEVKAFAWATEKARQHAREKFSNQLPEIKEMLANGSPEKRLEILRVIARDRLTLIMDDTFVSVYARCAEATEPNIRSEVARQAGERWIWSAEKQNPEAIDLMLKLSQDEDREVRNNAVYFGLSTVRNKSEKVVRRLLEMAFADREPNLFGRIVWGLKSDREAVKRLLDEYLKSSDPHQVTAVLEIYETFTTKTPAKTSMTAPNILEGLPPVVVETSPTSGAREVSSGVTEIRVRFSKEMFDRSWSWSTAWDNSVPEIIGGPKYETDKRTCVIAVKLEADRTYAFWLNSEKFHGFKDASGKPAVPYLLIFKTIK